MEDLRNCMMTGVCVAALVILGCEAGPGSLTTGTTLAAADAVGQDVAKASGATAADKGQPDAELPVSTWKSAEPHVVTQGAVRVELPANALAQEVALTITAMQDAPVGCVGQAWQFGPDGQTFTKPVRIVLAMPPGLVPTKDFAKLRLATVVAGKWQALASTGTTPEANEVWGETTHFSPYCAIPTLPPANVGPCGGLQQAADGTCTCTAKMEQPNDASYGYCKALFVIGLDACGDSYQPWEKVGPCCVQLVTNAGGPAATGQKQPPTECMAKAPCAAAMADPWGTAQKCGAFE